MIQAIVKGIVIEESLLDGRLPFDLQAYVVGRYPYRLDGITPVNILLLQVSINDLPMAAFALAEVLLPSGYYAHFVESPDRLRVIFYQCICTVQRSDPLSIARCRELGLSIGVSEVQMQFDKLFHEDHPNVH